jgi:(heptosyl)LPS beta-1,4-glucosyltransferase
VDKRPSIASVTITLNEEGNIRECLESLDWVDEIVIVDAFSSDRTADICHEYTQKIIQRPWPGFGAQKNIGIDLATTEWILVVDADERITPPLRNEILQVISDSEKEQVGYHIARRNYWCGKWIRHAGMYPDYQLRLFKKSAGRYDDVAVHEHLILDGSTSNLQNPMDHYTERQLSDHFKKFSRYTSYAAVERAKTTKKVRWTHLAFNQMATFLKVYFIRQGFREGTHGLIISVWAAMYTFVKYAKLWEKKQTG